MSTLAVPAPARQISRPVRWSRPAPRPEDWQDYEEWASGLDADARAEMEAQYHDAYADTDPPDWPAWTDARVEELPLAEWIALQADRFASLDTEAGDLVARAVRELAELVRFTRAGTPGQFLDRLDAYNDAR